MLVGRQTRKFRPIANVSSDSTEGACNEDGAAAESQQPKLVRPVPKSGNGPIVLDFRHSDNVLQSIDVEQFSSAAQIVQDSDSSRGEGSDPPIVPRDDLVDSTHGGGQTVGMGALDGISSTDLVQVRTVTSLTTAPSSGGTGLRSSAEDSRQSLSTMSFLDDATVEGIASVKPPRFGEDTRFDSILSEASAPTNSLAKSPTITSIRTDNSSGVSTRESELLRPLPERPARSVEPTNGQALSRSNGSNLTDGVQQDGVDLGNALSLQSARNATFVRKSAPLFSKKHSDNGKFARKLSVQPDKPSPDFRGKGRRSLFSASTSSTDSTDGPTNAQRKSAVSQGAVGDLKFSKRLFERKKSSKGSDGEGSNPWFQERSPEVNEVTSQDHADDSLVPFSKFKKGRKRLGIRFRKESREQESNRSVKAEDSVEPAISKTNHTLRVEDGSLDLTEEEEKQTSSVDYDQLEQELRSSLAAKSKLEEVLEKIIWLPERPRDEISRLFYKFLSSNAAVERGMKLIISEVDPENDDAPLSMLSTDSSKRMPYRELLVYSYVNGPHRLRDAIMSHKKAKADMLKFLSEEHLASEKRGTSSHAYRIYCVTRVLNSLLLSNAQELTDYISGQKGLLQRLVRNCIYVPEVVDFVSQLCSANALSDALSDEHRYGAPNASGILLIDRERICDLLVGMFIDSSRANGVVSCKNLRWQTQVMSVGCLLELSKRCVAVPAFSKANCSYSSKHIKAVNSALQNINSFENLGRVETLLNVCLEAIDGMDEEFSSEIRNECNNAAVCALSFVTELIEYVHAAARSKSIVTQRTVGRIDTYGLEELMMTRVERLSGLLRKKHGDAVRGRLKIGIVKLFIVLFGSTAEETQRKMARSGLANVLLEVLRENKRCSILLRCIIDCLTESMSSESASGLYQCWFEAMQVSGGLMDELGMLLDDSEGEAVGQNEEENSYTSSVIEIGLIMWKLSENMKRGEFRGLFSSEGRYNRFINVIEPGLRQVEEERKGSCGGPKPEGHVESVLANAESLAARLDDVNAV